MSLKQELSRKQLKVYCGEKGWLSYDSTRGYENTEESVRFFLLNANEKVTRSRISVDKGIHTHILGVDIHRGCVVCYVNQTNLESETTRYLVFGFERESDYGIGTTLESVKTDKYYENSKTGKRNIVKHL